MKIPILMYHSIGVNSSKLSISLENFDKQMRHMKKKNYNSISFDKINDITSENKYFIITFDDGYENVFYNALPILKKYNFVATCFFVTEYTGSYNVWDENKKNFIKQKLMNIDQIKDWVNSGMLAGSHTLTHPNLKNIPYEIWYPGIQDINMLYNHCQNLHVIIYYIIGRLLFVSSQSTGTLLSVLRVPRRIVVFLDTP